GAVLAAFLGSLALGSWVFGRRADRVKEPLRLYARLELGTGALALATLGLLPHLGALGAAAFRWCGGERPAPTFLRLLLALVLFIVLLGLAAGGLVGGRLSETGERRRVLAGAAAVAAACAGAYGLVALTTLSDFLGELGAFFAVSGYWGTILVKALGAARVA